MADLLLLDLDNGPSEGSRQAERFAGRLATIDIYALDRADLTPYRALIIPAFSDQEWLYAQRAVIRQFLDGGRVLLFSGHLFRPWLPGGSAFVPRQIRSHADYEVRLLRPHPLFDGVNLADLVYRRGVAGFFARGSNPPPPGAEPLLAFDDGTPVLYLDRVSSGGTLLVHSGNDLFGYFDVPAGETTFGARVLAWIDAEYERQQREGIT
ncbi:MAG: phosphate starvation-inducible protein PhoH [Dehalococcoidia bacterium]|nr:phosphate starvation-inducible protein PhoH [Dehalococcoidia bacterium]